MEKLLRTGLLAYMAGDHRSPLRLHISHAMCFRHNVGAICDRTQRSKKALFGEEIISKQGFYVMYAGDSLTR